MIGEVISVGEELLQGRHADTNAAEIARELLAAGVRVLRFSTACDERAAIAEVLREASARCDLAVVTGGLGPTEDDLTREGAADAMGVGLEFVPELWERVVERHTARGLAVPESNRRQAERPAGAQTIPNPLGTAPGFSFRLGKARFFVLPGVPREMRGMLKEHVLPTIAAEPYFLRTVKCFGATEAAVGERIARWMRRDANPLVGITVSRAIHTISILARGSERLAEETAAAIAAELGDLVFAREDLSLEEALGRLLLERKLTIALAESCTGGLATALLTSVPGISAALREAWVPYANEAKIARLRVDASTIATHGAVSAETAAAMARGALRESGADVAVAVTGIAGPEGGSAEKPVGLVWFAVALREGARGGEARVMRRNYARMERNFLREVAAREALNLVRLLVLGRNPGDPAP